MCKASIEADFTRDGEVGDNLNVSTGRLGLGTFHPPKQSPAQCAVCFQTGAKMVFTNIPETIRRHLGIGETESAIFIETAESRTYLIHDLVKFDGHPGLPPVPLAVLAGAGVRAEVIFVPSMDIPVSAIVAGYVADVFVCDDEQADDIARWYGEMRRAA